jgi:small GTP-binding protein
MYSATFKIVIFGDAGSGKTTLAKRFLTNSFHSNTTMTVGVEFETKCLTIDGMRIKLLIWDFAGEERFRFIFPHYLAGAKGGILMYDITDDSSFAHINEWLSVVNGGRNKFPILLLGSKCDLDLLRTVQYDEGIQIAKLMGLDLFLECSSKTGENVEKAFKILTKVILNRS